MRKPKPEARLEADCVALCWDGEIVLRVPHAWGLSVRLGDGDAAAPRLVESVADGGAVTLRREWQRGDGSTCRATETFTVRADPARIERRVTVERSGGGRPARLFGATARLASALGDRAAFSVPMARMTPATPARDVLRRPAEFPDHRGQDGRFPIFVTAPDAIAGAVTGERSAGRLGFAVVPLPLACPVHTRLHGRDSAVCIEHEFLRESWLRDGEPIEVAAQANLLGREAWRDRHAAVGRLLAGQGFAPPAGRPEWAKNAIIYEAEIGFEGGLRRLTQKLQRLKELGFNTVYLMPWHQGGYGTLDYEAMNPDYGTFDDLEALTAAAHKQGTRVLFDLLVNIAADGSPYLAEHPDWFYRDAEGRPLPHPAWKSNCFDPASPGFRRFLTDYAVRCCEEWGADGFRVDAVAYRGGLWSSRPGLQPHEHAHAVFSLVGGIRDAIRAGDPGRILLAECFGPQQVPVSDLVCYQWIEWLDWALERVESGALDGATIARLLGEHFAVMPRDTWLATYTHTHDTVAFAKRDIQGPGVDAFFTTLALLSAGTMVFGGGWRMRARPSEAEEAAYRVLFALEARLGGVACSAVRFLPMDSAALCAAERPSAEGWVRVITNFSKAAQPLPATGPRLYSRLGSDTHTIAPFDTVVEVL